MDDFDPTVLTDEQIRAVVAEAGRRFSARNRPRVCLVRVHGQPAVDVDGVTYWIRQ